VAIVVGLGNPGPEYERTRHNVGFMVADVLLSRLGKKGRRKAGVLFAEGKSPGGRPLAIVKPLGFMNLSGPVLVGAVGSAAASEELIVVTDDLDLESGEIRVRPGGGSGGHKGVQSLIESLGTDEFPRVRVGIGRPPGRMDPADYVLREFSPREREEMAVAIEHAADAALCLVDDGVAECMNRYNG